MNGNPLIMQTNSSNNVEVFPIFANGSLGNNQNSVAHEAWHAAHGGNEPAATAFGDHCGPHQGPS
jgi:hypothetical protein